MDTARRAGQRALVADVAVMAVLGAVILLVSRFAAANQVPPRLPLDGLAYALLSLACAALLLRRTWPFVALGTATAAVTTHLALGYPYGPVLITIVVTAYSVAAEHPPRRSGYACGAAFLVLFAGHVAGVGWPGLLARALPAAVWAGALLVAPWAVGTAVRTTRESRARAREDEARPRAYEERLQVVQEVHDVVGHGLSAIHLQSEVALHVLDQKPEQARPALDAISRTSKDALDELRATLALFRSGDAPSPTPGLDQLDALTERMAQAGLPVRVSTTGQARDLPSAVDLAAYRIVQESLTNVLRHAGPTSAEVRVQHEREALEVEITDRGRGSTGPAGSGIAGMRRRAAAIGGTVEVGPLPTGGYRVHAHLPLTGEDA
jgi:signal transduction histidine kinase